MRLFIRHRPVVFMISFIFLALVFYLGRLSKSTERSNNILPLESQNVKEAKTYLLILIMSAPSDINERHTVRESWLNVGSFDKSEIIHLFAVGTQNLTGNEQKRLEVEADEYNDLLLINKTLDSFDNLAKKTAYSIEAAARIYDFDFLLKTDTDSFVRVGYLLKALRDVEHSRLYWGFLDGRAKPFRRGKYKETGYVLCDRYLPYQLGGGYVLARALALFIADNIKMLKFYRSEDVSVGFWLAGLSVKYVHDPRFDTEYISRGCNNRYLITHKHSRDQLLQYADNVRRTGHLCESEFQTRLSYVYDFSVPPSQCCTRVNGSKIL